MSGTPVVSVIMPLHNGEAFLAEALASVLGQVEADFEVILVDDGSSDGTRRIAEYHERKHPSVRLLSQGNAGVTVARNRGVAVARGEYLAFLDQDDRWRPEALATHLCAFGLEPALAYTVAHQRCFLEPGADCPDWFRLQPPQFFESNFQVDPDLLVGAQEATHLDLLVFESQQCLFA